MTATDSPPSELSKISALRALLPGFGIAIAVMAVLGRQLHWWDEHGLLLINSPLMGILLGALFIALGATFLRRPDAPLLLSRGVVIGLVFVFFSDWLTRGYNLLQAPLIRGEIILFTFLSAALILYGRRWPLYLFALIVPILLSWAFLTISDGALIASDDHSTFYYRLQLLKENFPSIPFYSPHWNGGIDARDFFATGALNLFFINFPLVYLFDLRDSYNLIVCIMVFILPAAAMFLAARLAGLNTLTASCAAVLAISAHLLWFRWGLKYGTLGFIGATSLMPLNVVLAAKVLDPNTALKKKEVALGTISITLMLLWSASGLAFIPLILWGICTLPRHIRSSRTLILCLLLVLINLPWISIFWTVSSVSVFLQSEQTEEHRESIAAGALEDAENERVTYRHAATGVSFKKALSVLRESTVSMNPLLLLLSIPGLLLLPKGIRAPYLLTAGWLLFMGTILVTVKPQLELDRMLIMLALLLALPTASALASLFEHARLHRRQLGAILSACIPLGVLLTGPFASGAVVHNRSYERYYFTEPSVDTLVAKLNELNSNGRVLFSGFVLHHLSNGHLAPLASRVRMPLMASSQVHNLWSYRQIFPKEFLERGDAGIQEYLDLYNVSAVFAHEERWKSYFAALPQLFQERWSAAGFTLFERTNPPESFVLDGEGRVLQQTSNRVTLQIASNEAVLKFNYFPFVTSSTCTVEPYRYSSAITLVKLSQCPAPTTVDIYSVSAAERVWGQLLFSSEDT